SLRLLYTQKPFDPHHDAKSVAQDQPFGLEIGNAIAALLTPPCSSLATTTTHSSHQRADLPLPHPQRHRNRSLDSKDAKATAQEALTDWVFGQESAAEVKWMEELEVLKAKKDVRRGFVDSGHEGSGQGQGQGKRSFVGRWEDGGDEEGCACGVMCSVSTSAAKSCLGNFLEEGAGEEGGEEEKGGEGEQGGGPLMLVMLWLFRIGRRMGSREEEGWWWEWPRAL
ncbi:hypothetical protein DXG01_008510, partial [Tephrocybe rancida]